jgi:hypothetical protein
MTTKMASQGWPLMCQFCVDVAVERVSEIDPSSQGSALQTKVHPFSTAIICPVLVFSVSTPAFVLVVTGAEHRFSMKKSASTISTYVKKVIHPC